MPTQIDRERQTAKREREKEREKWRERERSYLLDLERNNISSTVYHRYDARLKLLSSKFIAKQ